MFAGQARKSLWIEIVNVAVLYWEIFWSGSQEPVDRNLVLLSHLVIIMWSGSQEPVDRNISPGRWGYIGVGSGSQEPVDRNKSRSISWSRRSSVRLARACGSKFFP